MTNPTIEQISKSNADTLAMGGKVAMQAAKANAEMLTKSGSATFNGLEELTKACQALATRNAERLNASLQALATVKTPLEFIDLQSELIMERVEAAVSDFNNSPN